MNHALLKRIIFEQHEVIQKAQIIDRDVTFEKKGNYVITGLRRAGKSTLLYKRVKELVTAGVSWGQIIYVNFDDERLYGFGLGDFDDILETAEEISPNEHYYFFDEIQNIDGWERFAIRLANQGLKVDIAGSNAKMLSKEIEGRLGGRYLSKEILPYSFAEFLRAKGVPSSPDTAKEKGRLLSALHEYFQFGGFPESLSFSDRREYVSNVFQKVLYGDIVARQRIRNENGLKLLIRKTAESVGQDLSYTRLQSLISGIGHKISKDVVIDYCSYCQDAYLFFQVQNYYASFLDKNSNPKFYFMDNGLLSLFVDDKAGALLENLVATALYRRSGGKLYYLKSKNVDADFYLSEEDAVVQVAYSIKESAAYDRETSSLVKYAHGGHVGAKLFIVTYEEEQALEIEGCHIEVIPLWKFLLQGI